MINLLPVESSMLASVGYDPERRILIVLFNNGKAYQYYDVPQEEYEGLMAAESKGSYMRQHVIDVYPYARFRGWKEVSRQK